MNAKEKPKRQEVESQWNRFPGTEGITTKQRENQGQKAFGRVLLLESAPMKERKEERSLRSRGAVAGVGGGNHSAARVKLWPSSLGNPEDGRTLQVYSRLE